MERIAGECERVSAPRVLVLGNVFGTAKSGVLRHATEVLPRAAALLHSAGGALEVLAGAAGLAPELALRLESAPATVRPSDLPTGPPLRRARAERRAVARVLRDAARTGSPFDLVHTGHLPVVRVPRGTALCWMLHDLRQLDAHLVGPRRAFLARWLIPASARRADAIVCPSRAVASSLAANTPPARGKTTAIWHGADHFEPLPREPGPGPLLHLGHLEPRKNIALLIRALATDPSLPELHLRGAAKGEEQDRLATLARDLDVAARVHFHGPYTDAELPMLLARAAAVVVPSTVEGFGFACIEALRAGVPLAVARAGALPEVAGPFSATFASDAPDQAAAAIRFALKAPPSQLDRGRRHAAAFTWDRSAARLTEAWTQACEPRA